MNIEIPKKLLKREKVTETELNQFITDYVKMCKNEDITAGQLLSINGLIKAGIFNIFYAAEMAIRELGVPFTQVFSKQGELLKLII